uniref:G-protein coupled receptors family 1 profile domain-containing protein n=1 Tax=Clastoptera arizonana TaxID=38151 RepID=A0A1B6CKR2_9HEMI
MAGNCSNPEFKNVFNHECSGILSQYLFAFGLFILCIFGWFGNWVICAVIAFQPRMRSGANYYIFSHAICDSLCLLVVLFWSGYSLKLLPSDSFLTMPILSTGIFTNCTSVGITLALAADRYIAVCHPLHCRTLCSNSRAVLTILGISIINATYPSAYGFCSSSTNNVFCQKIIYVFTLECYLITFYFLPVVAICILYFLIVVDIRSSSRWRLKRMSRTMQSLRIPIIIVIECLLCLGPFNVMALIHNHYPPMTYLNIVSIIYKVTYFLFVLTTTINPVLYLLVSTEFRKFVKVFFKTPTVRSIKSSI